MKMNLVTVMVTLKTGTVMTTPMAVSTMEMMRQPLSLSGGYTEEDDLNEEDLAISDDEADLHGDTAESFSFASLVNTLPHPLCDDKQVPNDPVTIESVVPVKCLCMTWFNTHSVGDLRRALISFLPQGVWH
jgi:hypothetical protein